MSSILGAIGAGDIGDHFPDTDSKNKDIDSKVIVMLAIKKALSMKLILNNLDITLLLESPKISDYKNEIKENLIKIFMEATKGHYTDNMFNIKASTSESLGFIGKGQGVTCYCIVSLKYL